ncbi:PKD domain-containing protein [Methanoculleus frigidifontis]|nr:PKD domain-containing protein [Methanoculleus sp. FWC-SCC1]
MKPELPIVILIFACILSLLVGNAAASVISGGDQSSTDVSVSTNTSVTTSTDVAVSTGTAGTAASAEGVRAVDVALAIDSSASMRNTDPDDLRIDAARLFVDLAADNDQLAIVDFDHEATLLEPLSLVGDNRTALKSAIDRVDSSGETNIGGGMLAAFDQLAERGVPGHGKATVLLTDGVHNTGTDPAEVIPLYVEQGWPVYTVALTDFADEALMKEIAARTGGRYYSAPTSSALLDIYNRIKQTIKGQDQVARSVGTVQVNQTVQNTVNIDTSVQVVEFTYIGPTTEVNYYIFYPNGTRVELDPASPSGTESPDITYVSADTYEIYQVNNPAPGDWSYAVDASEANVSVDYSSTVAVSATVNLSASIGAFDYAPGDPVTVTANIRNETTGIDNATVNATFTLPDGANETVLLNAAGNGTYTGVFTNTSQLGTYQVQMQAEVDEIVRQEVLEFEVTEAPVTTPTATPTPTLTPNVTPNATPTVTPTPTLTPNVTPTPEPTQPVQQPSGAFMQVTDDPADQMYPDISGDLVVWQDNRDGNWDIFRYNLSDGAVTQITTDPANQENPAVSGISRLIVWEDDRSGDEDIFWYSPFSGEASPVTTAPGEQRNPSIAFQYVCWQDNQSGTWTTYVADLSPQPGNGTPAGMPVGSQENPGIAFGGPDGPTVWQDDRNGSWDIYWSNLGNGEMPVCIDAADQQFPAIDGLSVVWQDNRNGGWDIYAADLETGNRTQVTDDPSDQMYPDISGDSIVWQDNRDGNWDIFLYDRTDGTVTRVTDDPGDQMYPSISGNYIVWQDDRDGNWDIFLYAIDGILPAPPVEAGPAEMPAPVVPPLAVSISANSTSGTVPLTVAFNVTVAGDPTTWNWMFGDGTSATVEGPVAYTYTTPGTYTAALTVSNATGAEATDTETITALPPDGAVMENITGNETPGPEAPDAAFSAEPMIGVAPLNVTFLDRSTGSIDDWRWEFGDGNVSFSPNTTYTYTEAGNYTVTLMVGNAAGSDTANETVQVLQEAGQDQGRT